MPVERQFDVVTASDFRYPGGTSHSVSQEVQAQSEAGMRTGLLHIPRGRGVGPDQWSPEVTRLLQLPNVELVTRYDPVRTPLLVLRHPVVIETTRSQFEGLRADRIVMVANQAAIDGEGDHYYDVDAVDRKILQLFGSRPLWAPIGPVVRHGLAEQSSIIDVLDYDWVNIIDYPKAIEHREACQGPLPIIGRHSRPNWPKWPGSKENLLAAYPADESLRVEILGGADPAEDILGSLPDNWNVTPFGGEEPADFLQRIDFWVFFHHPRWREAFGRAILEAMASGAVVLLPAYMEELFGPAAIYCEPEEVKETVFRYFQDAELFENQSRRAAGLARQYSPDRHVSRLHDVCPPHSELSRSVPSSSEERGIVTVAGSESTSSQAGDVSTKRVLFVTSNGNGIGHLTRLMSVAKRRPSQALSVFASMSTGVQVAGEMGFPFEYIPSWEGLGSHWRSWSEDYLRSRLETLISRVRPDTIVFDGTMPYQGLLDALSGSAAEKVWMRRAMWKPEVETNISRRSEQFNLILEPGEYAQDYDEGLTTRQNDAIRVNPIVLFDESEILSREDARRDLGYDQSTRYVLITLSSGSTNDTGDVGRQIIDWFGTNRPHWTVVMTRHPLAGTSGAPNVEVLKTYPLARKIRAFDAVISACGYNSFHELLALKVPTAWLPNNMTHTDDQAARARWSSDAGTGIYIDSEQEGSMNSGLTRLTDDGERASLREEMAKLGPANGGEQAARALEEGGWQV